MAPGDQEKSIDGKFERGFQKHRRIDDHRLDLRVSDIEAGVAVNS
jgi:hypothetical protein